MAITSYCKKCGQDVPRGDVCPQCGARLPKTSARVVWSLEHRPVRDWMCWNAALRIMAPAAAAVLLLILLLEALAGGWQAAERLLEQGLLLTWATLSTAALAVLWLVLLAQGADVVDCVVDSKGVHVTTYLENPTTLSLLARLRSPALMREAVAGPAGSMVQMQTREVSWREISRVQLWPDKAMILFYAPAWWMRLALPCSAFQYASVLEFMRDKVGRRKDLLLPDKLRVAPKPRKPRGSAAVEEPVMPLTEVVSTEASTPEAAAPQELAPLSETETASMQALLDEMRQATAAEDHDDAQETES